MTQASLFNAQKTAAPEQGGAMHIYLIDDGEKWWIVAESAEQALELARRDDIDCWRELSASDVEQLPDDSTVKVLLMDGLHWSETGLYPIKRYCRYYNGGGWVCEATAAEWAGMRRPGDIIASTVY